MSNSSNAPWPLLDRYLASECSPAEQAEVERWIAADPSHQQIVSALRARTSDATWDTNSAWTRLSGQMAATPFSPAARPRPLWGVSTGAMRAAAAVVLLAGATTIASYFLVNYKTSAPVVVAMREISTARGERRDVELPDGSRVTLAAESRLRYPERLDGAARDVELTGEAYFSIAHDSTRPFSVRAPGVVTRVLGTEFNVRSYSATTEAQVVVASGRVLVRPSHDSMATGAILTAGNLGRVQHGAGEVAVERGVAVDQYLGWKSGRLHFSTRPLREVLADLEHWFDAELVVRDSVLGARILTTDVRVGAGGSLNDVMNTMAVALDARVERSGRTITLVPLRVAR
jgi:ferric-dicitrate binding protein FerR (iron transport regulator)